MQVNLDLVAWRTGAKASLWNRTAGCRRLHCTGIVDFLARAPGMNWRELLQAEERAP